MQWDGATLNRELFEEQYRRYLKDSHSVDPTWRELFEALPPEKHEEFLKSEPYMEEGHLFANVNPLRTKREKRECPFKEDPHLKATYCGRIGYEFSYIENEELLNWIKEKIEPIESSPRFSHEKKRMILDELNRSSLFESFLQTKYVGQKRFSLEGGETLIPMLHELLLKGSELGLKECFIGMAHRGRLNVLTNILEKSHADVFSEFEGSDIPEGSGDVKYHKGFSSVLTLPTGKQMRVHLTPNPSHLESVNPVVEGEVRARQEQLEDAAAVLPLLIHGDAALAGQGVVYETLQMSQLKGYSTSGTVHIVINNQIGFTTLPEEGRSTRYCTDIAKSFGIPVFHVNAEDPEACVFVTDLAIEMRQRFQIDVYIDLLSYRKYGHNESDEPAFTQPLEYQEIRGKRSIREIYFDQLLQEGVVEKQLEETFKEELQEILTKIREKPEKPLPLFEPQKEPPESFFEKVDTAVSFQKIQKVIEVLSTVPQDMVLHPKLLQLIEARKRQTSSLDSAVDWGTAEALAFGTLLEENVPIRLSGQDSCRGTFSHRLAEWVDQKVEKSFVPLQKLGKFAVYNSPLSEFAVLGFEYGYSVLYPTSLNIWEAQFGDFANGAQVIIDQYIATGAMKWGQRSNIVLLLPHGYEGQGPEHSSGRMERFLTLSAEENMIIANVTTPAQAFHILRRQMKKPFLSPLILFTPKGLLRYPACVSSLREMIDGSFQEILAEERGDAEKILFCTGRIYYDLIQEREKRGAQHAIVRIEQIYPLDMRALQEKIRGYSKANRWIWVQEEPSNMGAWKFMRNKLQKILPKGSSLEYVGRERSASPATGSHRVHQAQYEEIMRAIYG